VLEGLEKDARDSLRIIHRVGDLSPLSSWLMYVRWIRHEEHGIETKNLDQHTKHDHNRGPASRTRRLSEEGLTYTFHMQLMS